MRNGFRPETTGTPPRRVPSAKVLAWMALAGTLLLADALRDDGPPQPTAAQARPPLAQTAVRADPNRPGPRPLPASQPARIRIPAIKVDASLTPLELDGAGALQPPPATAPTVAGWYADGTTPGASGTAVVAGHVDTPLGPAVFHRLGALFRGAEIAVEREDGRTALFTVDAVEVHAKDRFPDDQVYGSSGRPELRLITCGGDWSRSTGYRANTVVYATLTGTR
ncbi:class F sortase [Streptomyces sp. NPDC046712]|uniref:class F sortase n=1 Tax=Streptomyces sp. NPDC046712 TaxID=3154802 RepID=UPI0033DC9F0D